MRISEVTARSGVPATTLRYYEDLGLIHSQRSRNGYRDYHSEVLEQLSFIDTAKKMNLDLTEIKWLLEVTETGTCTSTREALRPVLTDRLSQVEESISRLTILRDHLARSLEDVVTCPDSPEPCKSECAFKALTEERGKGPQVSHLKDLSLKGKRARRKTEEADDLEDRGKSHTVESRPG